MWKDYLIVKSLHVDHNSIYFRVCISFLLVIAPIIIIGIVLFSWEMKAIQTEIKKSASDNISFLRKNMESELDSIRLLQNNLSNDQTLITLVNKYKYVPTYEYFTMIQDVRSRLIVMKNSNAFIDDVMLYVPGIDHAVSAQNGYVSLDSDSYGKYEMKCRQAQSPLVFDNEELYMTILYPFGTTSGTEPSTFLIKVGISKEKIGEFLAKYSQTGENDTCLCDLTTKTWIFGALSKIQYKNMAALAILSRSDGNNAEFSQLIGEKKYYVSAGYSQEFNFAILQYIPMDDIFRLPNIYKNLLWVYSGLSVFIVILYSFFTYRLIKRPIDKMVGSFRHLDEGDLNINISCKSSNEFNYLFDEFNKMVSCLNALIESNYKQQMYAQKAELKQLQSQINPHFLYNSFFMLDRLIKCGDHENAHILSSYLGKYFRFITRSTMENVTLAQEVEHADSYAQIQQMRFSRQLIVDFGKVPENYRELMVPRMILQPILENSIEHGLRDKDEDGLLRVVFTEQVDHLTVTFDDNGENLSDDDIKKLNDRLTSTDDNTEITGLLNVHRRLRLKFGAKSGITVTRSNLGGLKVQINIYTDTESEQ